MARLALSKIMAWPAAPSGIDWDLEITQSVGADRRHDLSLAIGNGQRQIFTAGEHMFPAWPFAATPHHNTTPAWIAMIATELHRRV